MPALTFPPSFEQQRMWLLHEYARGTGVCNIPASWWLRGIPDEQALQTALRDLVHRHESLRTTFAMDGETLVQRVAPEAIVHLRHLDFSSATDPERDARLWLECEAQATFELESGPLIRTALLRLSPSLCVLSLTIHHIVADGWSVGVLMNELGELYAAEVEKRQARLPVLEIQYADYAVWQRQWFEGEPLREQLQYWRGVLEGAPPLLLLPTDKPRPATMSHAGASVDFVFDKTLNQRIRELSRQCDVTLFMTLAAAFNALLHRYSGQDDICIGYPVANRQRPEVEPLIGFFVNTLVLRTRIDAGASFKTLLKQVRESVLDANAHQDLPFEKLVSELSPQRSTSHAPLFQVMLGLNNTAPGNLDFAGIPLEALPATPSTAKFDLLLDVYDKGSLILGGLVYRTDLFEAGTIERMVARFVLLLERVVANPDIRIDKLPLLLESEQRWLDSLNGHVGLEDGVVQCVHERFERQVRLSPDAIALTSDQEEVSYAELDRRANRLAHHLVRLGARPDELVGVCLPRSIDMVVGLLGVLKAGACYVPLDPAYPQDRLTFMLEDSGARILLAGANVNTPRIPDGVVVVRPDADSRAIHLNPSTSPGQIVRPGHAAYCLYTSGSTGRPKGVLIEHRSVVSRLAWMQATYRLNANDRLLQKTSLNFDVSVWEVFWPISTGATLHLPAPGEMMDPETLVALLIRQGITFCHFNPTVLERLLDHPKIGNTSLRHVVCGGEPLDSRTRDIALEVFGGNFHNRYGPTEATINATCWQPGGPDVGQACAIGRPLTGTRIYILDSHGNHLPPGVAGEICIAGDGLARGYLNSPGLTAERFVPDPFGATPGARMYRSGDMARYLPGGDIEFVGRKDDQVKLRGFRIELGEVQSALLACAGVREAAVQVRDDRLVAYVVCTGLDERLLNAQLARQLPQHMLPSTFVVLDKLPLNQNGKVDRAMLLAQPLARTTKEWHSAPRTPDEELIAAQWEDVLGCGPVGHDDSFFLRGGHSLLAAQLVARLRVALNLSLEIRDLFEAPTLALFAERVRAKRQVTGNVRPGPIERHREPEVPASYAQQRLWFLEEVGIGGRAYNMAYGWRIHGPLDAAVLENCLAQIVGRHEVLRTTFALVDGEPMQVVVPHDSVALITTNLSTDAAGSDTKLQRLCDDQAALAFDLQNGPLMRVNLVRLGADEHALLLTLHHIVADGWSIGVLMNELGELYAAQVEKRQARLPVLEIQYADYAVWQRQWFEGERLLEQLQYWRGVLQGAPPLLQLPTDKPRPATMSYEGAAVDFTIDETLSQRIKALSRQCNVTLFMTLAAAFNVLLSRYSGQDDICIGFPVANRQRPEVEPLIGFFVNTLVLRTRIDPGTSFTTLLKQVRESVLDAHAHQDLPFEKLVSELSPHRSTSHAPVFQVMLALNNTAPGHLDLAGMRMEPLPATPSSAKFDLVLHVSQRESRLTMVLEYSTDLFAHSTVQGLGTYLQQLLEQAVLHPDRSLAALGPLAPAHHGSGALRPRMASQCIHHLVEERVDASPGAVAILDDELAVTYAEVDRRANEVANALLNLGVVPESLVAVCMERCADMVIAVLGVLKAGAAYVPVDPEFPRRRVEAVLHRSGAKVVLTHSRCKTVLAQIDGVHALSLDDDHGRAACHGHRRPRTGVCAANLAYCLFTSGSTGVPKATLQTHATLVNLYLWQQSQPAYADAHAATRRTLQFTNLGFDVSAQEILFSLCAGDTLVIPVHSSRRQIDSLGRLLAEQDVTALYCPNAVAQAFAAVHVDRADRHSLRNLICAGEPLQLTPELREFVDRGHGCRVHNQYGPTETHVVTALTLDDDWTPGSDATSIGRPIDNTNVYVLDVLGHPVPTGVPGEIHVAGPGVARGYLNQPDLTAERFVPDPFGPAGSRMYRTGDRGRYLPDGTLQFLGRLDNQIKIRGFRVELGEIETALTGCTGVRDAVVVLHDSGVDKRIVGYVVPTAGSTVDSTGLINQLREQLPDYMLPGVVIALDALPLNSNGKLDRRALPKPIFESAPQANGRPLSRTPLQSAIAAVWVDLLHVQDVGIHDNFFALGGHSLLAVQLAVKLRRNGINGITPASVFRCQTIAELARLATDSGGADADGGSVVPETGHAPLTFGQERQWSTSSHDPTDVADNIHVVVRLHGDLDKEALQRAIDELCRRHDALRTTIQVHDGVPRQVVLDSLQDVLQCHDRSAQLRADGHDAWHRITCEIDAPFKLAQAPLFRVLLYQIGEREHLFAITLHHIIFDGYSTRLMMNELDALYLALREGSPLPAAQSVHGLSDFARWQRKWVSSEQGQRCLEEWRRRLEPLPPPMSFGRSIPGPGDFRGHLLDFTCPPRLAMAVESFCRSHAVTEYVFLLACFGAAIQARYGHDEFLVNTPFSNRIRPQFERTLGRITEQQSLRVKFPDRLSFAHWVPQLHAEAAWAQHHQELPHSALMMALQPNAGAQWRSVDQVRMRYGVGAVDRDGQTHLFGLDARSLSFNRHLGANKALNILCRRTPGGLNGRLQYDGGLFEVAEVSRLLTDTFNLAAAAATDPGRPIGRITDDFASDAVRLEFHVPIVGIEMPAELAASCFHREGTPTRQPA